MASQSASSGAKYHPFFSVPQAVPPPTHSEDTETDSNPPASSNPAVVLESSSSDEDYIPNGQNARGPKKRKSDVRVGSEDEPRRGPGRPRKKRKSQPTSIVNHFVRPESTELSHGNGPHKQIPPESRNNTEAVGLPDHAPDSWSETSKHSACSPVPSAPKAKPKKMLNFNSKTGTLGSPPKPKEPQPELAQDSLPAKTTRRGKKGSLILRVLYGIDEGSRLRIGDKIAKILSSTGLSIPTIASAEESSGRLDRNAELSSTKVAETSLKPTHPFFLAKAPTISASAQAPAQAPVPPSPSVKQFTSTPCSTKMSRAAAQNAGRGPTASPTARSGFRNVSVKVPGARLPAWPWKGIVRAGCDVQTSQFESTFHLLPPKKSKGNATMLVADESLLANAMSELRVPAMREEVRSIVTDDFLPPPKELRLPQKHYESGRKLQLKVKPNLTATSLRGHAGQGRRPGRVLEGEEHGLGQFYESLHSRLSAFDLSQCETLCWFQKYAPASANEVLQSGRETELLKEWLNALKVHSVETAPGDALAVAGKQGPNPAYDGKKKRKNNKLDDFIVSSDDEVDELGELSGSDGDWASGSRPWTTKKTVVRGGDVSAKGGKEAVRLRNTVVISGPHGCGKSAAVYAVAAELDFEVFEINPSSRRSGKDILERIGDMTRNHLVQRQRSGTTDTKAEMAPEGELPCDDQVVKEVQSGKQATMNSFFKPKSAAKPKPKDAGKPGKGPAKQRPLAQQQLLGGNKSPPNSQKQSLILLEEVDVLYEEDKQFWATVMTLMAQSKRPFIMTCNDESMVPLQSLNLHGIFRFSPPPTDLAVDRLLLIAASEGHVLRRPSVRALYESRGCDLRASIAELNYWCQIGVGDRRGGFDWFYLRWPRGIDIDENGDTIRVISEDTYEDGIGWLGDETEVDPLSREVDVLQQAWENFGLDLGAWQDSPDMEIWANRLETATRSASDRLAALEAYDNFADAMSVADLIPAMASASPGKVPIDATLPALPSKIRDDYTVGLALLEAVPAKPYHSVGSTVAICLKVLARRELLDSSSTMGGDFQGATDETRRRRLAVSNIHKLLKKPPPSEPTLSRLDMAIAFDPIAASDETASGVPSSHLDPSVWDRTMNIITLDVAPFVRSIVAYDAQLLKQRLRLGNLMSHGGGAGPNKRMRTTRAAYSAMEGGLRSTTRGERWFKADLNPYLVKGTAPRGCDDREQPDEDAGQLLREETGEWKDLGDESCVSSPSTEPENGMDVNPIAPPVCRNRSAKSNTAKTRKGRRKVVRESSDVEDGGAAPVALLVQASDTDELQA